MKIAFITGITGQDGSFLKELLLEKGYIVYGLVRMISRDEDKKPFLKEDKNLHLKYGDITDSTSIKKIFDEIENQYKKEDIDVFEVYNLAAMSHVRVCFDIPEYSADVDALGVLRILEIIRFSSLKQKIRFFQASTSELFGHAVEVPQNELTPFYPRSPYGVAKLYGYWITKNYRELYGIYACNSITFNHESERRGTTFVSRKITLGLSKILKGEQDKIYLGNIDSKRDWGYSKDYVYGMWLMLQQKEPEDFVLSTGKLHSVREFIELSFKLKGINIKWKGYGIDEIGYDEKTENELININPEFFRPLESDILLGDSTKARKIIGWEPKTTFEELVKIMVESDCK